MSAEENKALVRRYFEAGNQDNLAAWDDLCDPGMVLHTGFTEPVQGLVSVTGVKVPKTTE